MKKPRYTDADKEWLTLLFEQGKSDSEIAAIMGRTETGVSQKRRALRLHRPDAIALTMEKAHRWSKDDLLFINNYWRDLTDRQMARKLGVTLSTYKHKRQRMGFFKDWEQRKDRRRTWSFSDELFLRENYGTRSAKDIAEHLHRKENTIQCKAHRLGLKKDYIPGRRGYQKLNLKGNYTAQ